MKYAKHCHCEDWKPNIDIIDNFIMLGYTHRMTYNAKQFEYCPWCGEELHDEKLMHYIDKDGNAHHDIPSGWGKDEEN